MHSAPKPYMLFETDLICKVHNAMHLEMVTALIYILPKSHTHACYVPRTWAVLDCPRLQPLQLFVHLFIGVTPSSALTQQNKRYAHSSYSLVHMCAVRKSCYLLFCQLSMCNGMSQHLDLPFRDPHTLVCLHYLHLQFCECLCICI